MDLVGCPMLVPWNSASFPFLYPIPSIALVTTSAIHSSGDNVLQNKTIISSYRIQSKRKYHFYNYKVFVYLSDSYCPTTKSLYIYQILTVQLQSLCISIRFLLLIFISYKIMIHIFTWFGGFFVYWVCCILVLFWLGCYNVTC